MCPHKTEQNIQAGQLNNVPVTISDWTSLRTILVGFPTRADTWRDNAIPAQRALLTFVSQILEHTNETVAIVTSTLSITSRKVINEFSQHYKERLSVMTLPMDDCWLRDTGPIFVNSHRIIGTCFKFNAWGGVQGGCYNNYKNDALLNKRLCDMMDTPIKHVDIVLEGGSISSDGKGTIITTEECNLNPNRNPNLTKLQIEQVFKRHLGCRKIIWLPYGSAYDHDTNGHVDNIAVFAYPGNVILAYGGCDEQKRRSRAAAKVLERECDANGEQIIIHKVPVPILYRTKEEANGVIPEPGVVQRNEGRVCASYVNFLSCGDCVFVPRFGVAEDEVAKTVFVRVFNGRNIVMVDAREFVLAGGGLHCLTLGIPR